MIRCENCCNKVIGEYDRTEKDSTKVVYNENAKIMPCCKAEVCKDCYNEMVKAGKCLLCGRKI